MFEDNPNKALIRGGIDREAVLSDYRRLKRPLDYFGLPGPEMLDVQDWSDFLGNIVAVERDSDALRLMEFGASAFDVLSRMQVLFGDVDGVILEGVDANGERPWIETFDLVNLDYYSGLVLKDLNGDSRHLAAIRELFRKQEIGKRDFRLVITCNARNKDKGELDKVLLDIGEELRRLGRDPTENIEWHVKGPIDCKLKVWVPMLLERYASTFRFTLTDYRVVTYSGTGKARMVHFSLRFSFSPDRLNVKQLRPDILLTAPLFEARDGEVKPSARIPPSIRST